MVTTRQRRSQQQYFAIRKVDHKSPKDELTLLTKCVFKCTHKEYRSLQRHSKICWTIWRRQSKADCVLGMFCNDSAWFFLKRERHDSALGPEDLRCRGRSLGTCFDEIFPDSERGDKEFMFLRTPVSRCDHQGRMQIRLSALTLFRLCGSVGSAGVAAH